MALSNARGLFSKSGEDPPPITALCSAVLAAFCAEITDFSRTSFEGSLTAKVETCPI